MKVNGEVKQKPHCRGVAPNGLPNHIMAPVWKCLHLTKNLEAAPYLPQEEKSPLFSVQREGLPEDGTLYRINR
ncbi:General transcription factor 3C polypeptide 2 [Camelus dromedarius]|nr:General transcription factor 3C polypeptide 2 [Camelus dromedarius]